MFNQPFSMLHTVSIAGHGDTGANPSFHQVKVRVQYTLGRSAVYCMANTETNSHTLIGAI